jgi:hypothetical protein
MKVVVAVAGLDVSRCSTSPWDQSEKVDVKCELVSRMRVAKGEVAQIVWNLTKGEPDTLDPSEAATYTGNQMVGLGHIVESDLTAGVLDRPAQQYAGQLVDQVPGPGWRAQRSLSAAP